MADARPGDGLFDGPEARRREDLLTEFEDLWFAGTPADCAAFVRKHLPPWLPRRGPTVAELIRVDQEFRIKRGEPARVEDYLDRLDFRPDEGELLDLVVGEYVLRSRFQSPPGEEEYVRRFPQLAEGVRRRLAAVGNHGAAPRPGVGLRVVDGPHRGRVIRLEEGCPVLVGRSESADARFGDDPHLSAFHLRLDLVEGQVEFHDLGSRNGTSLNGREVESGVLGPGDLLQCGSISLAIDASPPVLPEGAGRDPA